MNRLNNIIKSLILIVLLSSCDKESKLFNDDFTAINTLAFTDVEYITSRDTVIVSKYSGQIIRKINNQNNELVIADLEDEIYSLEYSEKRNEIIASTMHSGIVILNVISGNIIKSLKVEKWCNSIHLSKDESYLVANDISGKNHIWNINEDYKEIKLEKALEKYKPKFIDKSGVIYFSNREQIILWNLVNSRIVKKIKITGNLIDVDEKGNLLFISHNECYSYNIENDSIELKISHPNWPYILKSGDTAYIPLQMKLLQARYANGQIYTAGIDRSIRKWDKLQDSLELDTWLGHKASINRLILSNDNSQMVSIDLKGGLNFWNINVKSNYQY